MADELDRNQSTISRAINGKYLDSPQGVQELAFFFSRSLTEAGDVSTRVAQEELRRIIEEEDPSRPYSDADLSALLRAKGLVVKRRTVANYRKLLDIPSASNRRRY
ncbi:MAG: RNA polymerase sigma-54 factor [candidate division Hyd24-12 bacterium ADurb.Bin004]|nr:MAG: RNA polymerase sigma-54 factor [candidate division Hyd24-12 bacterium ADurb.Bin004]